MKRKRQTPAKNKITAFLTTTPTAGITTCPPSGSTDDNDGTKKRKQEQGPALRQRDSGTNKKWSEEFPWLTISESGMFCKLCQKFDAKAKNGSRVWINEPCMRIRRASITDHSRGTMHLKSVEREAEAIIAKECGGTYFYAYLGYKIETIVQYLVSCITQPIAA